LFLLASGAREPERLRRIACIVLKVMHVVHHVEARSVLHRARVTEDELAQLVTARVDHAIMELRRQGMPIVSAAGNVKTRHSLITKLLAKKETLAAQVYDRVRYRVVTAHREDVLPVLVRLCDVLVPFNFVVPGQTQNTLFSFRRLVSETSALRKLSKGLQAGLNLEEHDRREGNGPPANEFSGDDYQVLNFVVDLPVRLPERAIDRTVLDARWLSALRAGPLGAWHRRQVGKARDCKSRIRRFESGRCLHLFSRAATYVRHRLAVRGEARTRGRVRGGVRIGRPLGRILPDGRRLSRDGAVARPRQLDHRRSLAIGSA
jgi:hypothetical protein